MKSNKPLKVLLIVGTLETGGIEKLVFDLCRRINRQQFRIEICCVKRRDGAFLKPLLDSGVPVHYFGDYQKSPVSFFKKYGAFIEKEQFDIIHVNMNHLSALFLRKSWQVGTAVRIAHYHNDFHFLNRFGLKGLTLRILQVFTDKYANKIIGISDVCLESVFGQQWRKRDDIERIYNGIDLDLFTPGNGQVSADLRSKFGIAADSTVIGHIGQFRKQKNHFFIVDLAKQLCCHFDNLVFFLVGDGPLLEQTRIYAKKQGVYEKFVFAGSQDDIPSLLRMMNFFLFPSLWEGFGLALLEAQATGLPVIVSENISSEIPLLGLSQKVPLSDIEGWLDKCNQLILQQKAPCVTQHPFEENISEFSIEVWIKKIEKCYKAAYQSERGCDKGIV